MSGDQARHASRAEIADRITAFIHREFLDGDPRSELDEDTPLLEYGVLNSLNTTTLVAFIHHEFGVVVPVREVTARNLRNVRSISEMAYGLTRTRID
jgi:acyl carrier protein